MDLARDTPFSYIVHYPNGAASLGERANIAQVHRASFGHTGPFKFIALPFGHRPFILFFCLWQHSLWLSIQRLYPQSIPQSSSSTLSTALPLLKVASKQPPTTRSIAQRTATSTSTATGHPPALYLPLPLQATPAPPLLPTVRAQR